MMFVFAIASVILHTSCLVFANPIASIKNGTLEGTFMTSRKGRIFSAFRGVPYAKPPLNELRFEPPMPAEAWKGTLPVKSDGNICTQRNIYTGQEEIVGEEDCLYLNVYTPKLPNKDCKDRCRETYPVMIWFHGGGWITGAGHSEFYGPKFLLDHDVVLVTLNYRLGPLGFMSTEDLVVPGNMGMKDQAQAIRWVNENIATFSGDPNRVTLFGESAGGASVHYHMISSLSKGLFHRGISQSGTALCPWTLTKSGQAKQKAHKVGKLLNCSTKNSKELVECLRKRDAKDIIGTDRDFQIFGYCPMIPFRPVIEPDYPGAFLKEHPIESVKKGRVMDIPWMTGITSQEGALKTPAIFGNNGMLEKLNEEFNHVLPLTILYEDTCPEKFRDGVTKKLKEFYFNNKHVEESTRFNLTDMYSDSWFTYPSEHTARINLQHMSAPTYFYYITYRGTSSFSEIFGDKDRDYGVSHADDLQYLFPVGEQLFPKVKISESDQKMIDVFTTLWFNFAHSGNPTPELTSDIPIKWKPLQTDDFEYMILGGPGKIVMDKNLLTDRMNFWRQVPHVSFPNTLPSSVKDEL